MDKNISNQEEEKNLLQQFSTLNLQNENIQKKLFIDILNFGLKFFSINKSFWDLITPQKKIEKFIKAAKNSNYDIEIFIDGSATTRQGESLEIWKQRRIKEVNSCSKNVPANLGILIGDIFKKQNIKVHYSQYEECDDVIASYAEYYKADILSGDKDIASKFPGATYQVYKDYYYSENAKNPQLMLVKHHLTNPSQPEYDSRKLILNPLPKVGDDNIYPELLLKNPTYIRGTPSGLVKYFGNPHSRVKPLRQAYYYHIKIQESVSEMYPEYDFQNKQAFFFQEEVIPDQIQIKFLEKPLEAVGVYFLKQDKKPQEISEDDWKNHLFCVYSVTFDLCRLYLKVSLLSLFEKFTTDLIQSNLSDEQEDENLQPLQITCRTCRENFEFSISDQKFYKQKNFQPPKMCKDCRKNKKQNY